MEGQIRAGARAWITKVEPSSKRKLRYTWELVEEDGLLVGANTVAPNRIIGELLAARCLVGLRRFRSLRREVAYGERSRVDFVLDGATPHFIEVKNAHLRYADGRAYFPDSVSVRARHHMQALAELVREGAKATVLFTVQRGDVHAVRPSILHDPDFAAAVREAARAGVRLRGLAIQPTLRSYQVLREIPVETELHAIDDHRRWRDEKLPWSGWQREPAAGA
jgi:sugar fermentation stimulation protein A